MAASNCERQLTSQIFLDKNASNLIIKYQVKLFAPDENGQRKLVNAKNAHKKIKLKQFSVNSDVSKIAKQIVSSASKFLLFWLLPTCKKSVRTYAVAFFEPHFFFLQLLTVVLTETFPKTKTSTLTSIFSCFRIWLQTVV